MPSAPIARPANAGPMARLIFKPTPLRATAERSSSFGTSCGTIDCHDGIARTAAIPDKEINVSSQLGVIHSSHTKIANRAATATAAICTTIRRRRRSTMSANAPAGRLNRNMGKVVAAWTRATSNGSGRRLVISHAAAAFCIQLPMLETTVAVQSTAKIAWRNGLHAEPSRSAVPGERSSGFISPSEIELEPDIVAFMPAGAADGAADPKMHGFDGARQMAIECIVSANLFISASPESSGTRCAGNGNIGYDIDGISRRLTPLWGDGGEKRQGARRLDGDRGLDVDQICIGGESSQAEVIAVREKRIEGSERIAAGVPVTRGRVDLKPQTGAPVCIGECEAADCSQRPGTGRFGADASGLDHLLEVPIPPTVVAGIMHIEDVA